MERTAFARGRVDAVRPKREPIRFPMAAGAIRERHLLAWALIERSRSTLEESARPSPQPQPATDIPYFDPPALRELARRARRFAEMLSPSYRRIMLEKARRLEGEAEQLEAGTRP